MKEEVYSPPLLVILIWLMSFMHHKSHIAFYLSTNSLVIIIVMTFDSNGFVIKEKKTNRILHNGTNVNGLYHFRSSSISSFEPFQPTKNTVVSDVSSTWHRRLGHPSFFLLPHLRFVILELWFTKNFPSCITCNVAKSHQTTFPEIQFMYLLSSWNSLHRCLEPLPPFPLISVLDITYFFVNDWYRFLWVYLIRSKF